MNWLKLKDDIYFEDGSLRDIYVFNTTRSDWQLWANYVNLNYKVNFRTIDLEIEESTIDVSKVSNYWEGIYKFKTVANIFIDNICVNSYFLIEEEIENDIDPKEFKSLEDHNKLMKYMIDLSKLLNKKVSLTLEDTPETVLISAFNGKIII